MLKTALFSTSYKNSKTPHILKKIIDKMSDYTCDLIDTQEMLIKSMDAQKLLNYDCLIIDTHSDISNYPQNFVCDNDYTSSYTCGINNLLYIRTVLKIKYIPILMVSHLFQKSSSLLKLDDSLYQNNVIHFPYTDGGNAFHIILEDLKGIAEKKLLV